MSPAPTLRAEHAEATRAAIVASARRLFVEAGYASTSVDQLAGAARVTKGAVYHHFSDKRGVLRAVHEQLAVELRARIEGAIADSPDPRTSARRALDRLLESADDVEMRRLLFQQGPTHLGQEARRIDREQFLGVIERLLAQLQAGGALARQDARVLSRILLGLLVEASQLLGHAESVAETRVAVRSAIELLLDGVLS